MTWAVDEGHVSDEQERGLATGGSALRAVLLLRAKGLVAFRGRASRAFVEFSVRITQLNGDVSESLLVVTHSLHHINV